MNIYDHLESEPMKYWTPPKTSILISQILANPEKYTQYTYTPKMDGEWNKMVWDGTHIYMLARNRNVQGQFADRWEKFPHINEEIKKLPMNTVLLGEIAFTDITKVSKDVGSVMRSLVPRALELQQKTPLHFYVFDCLMWDGKDLSDKTYQDRFMNNSEMSAALQGHQYIHQLIPQPMSTLVEYLSDYFARGGEGVVLIDTKSKYAFNSRPSKVSIKIKKQLADFKAQVIGTLEPTYEYSGNDIENWKYFVDGVAVTKPYYFGWKSAIRCVYEGREFSVASGLNDNNREWLSTPEAQEIIAKGNLYAIVSAMELTKDSVRHPYLVRLEIKK